MNHISYAIILFSVLSIWLSMLVTYRCNSSKMDRYKGLKLLHINRGFSMALFIMAIVNISFSG